MSVDNPEVIDFVVHNPKTNEVALVMVEARDWNAAPEALEQLHTKFRLYLESSGVASDFVSQIG